MCLKTDNVLKKELRPVKKKEKHPAQVVSLLSPPHHGVTWPSFP